MGERKNLIRRTIDSLSIIFLNGLFTILPLGVTLGLFSVTFRIILDWLAPIRMLLEKQFPGLTGAVPYVEILLIVGIIFIIGTLLKIFLLRSIVHTFEDIIVKIPLVRPVYSGIKQLVHAFSVQDKITFKKVVIVEFPRSGIYSIGFLTSQLPDEVSPQEGRKFFNVFVPTTPNPTSGYFIIVPEQDINIINLTRQEAMAMVISGGIIQPQRYMKK